MFASQKSFLLPNQQSTKQQKILNHHSRLSIFHQHFTSELLRIQVVLNLTTSNPAGFWIQIKPELDLGRTFGSQKNTLDKTNGVNDAINCYIKAVQFSAYIVMSLFDSF